MRSSRIHWFQIKITTIGANHCESDDTRKNVRWRGCVNKKPLRALPTGEFSSILTAYYLNKPSASLGVMYGLGTCKSPSNLAASVRPSRGSHRPGNGITSSSGVSGCSGTPSTNCATRSIDVTARLPLTPVPRNIKSVHWQPQTAQRPYESALCVDPSSRKGSGLVGFSHVNIYPSIIPMLDE